MDPQSKYKWLYVNRKFDINADVNIIRVGNMSVHINRSGMKFNLFFNYNNTHISTYSIHCNNYAIDEVHKRITKFLDSRQLDAYIFEEGQKPYDEMLKQYKSLVN